jgi:aminoglycoside/choline kinase family phosphotransferase
MQGGPPDPDRKALAAWLARSGFEPHQGRPLAGDVSPRIYERWTAGDGRTAILALYPQAVRAVCAGFARTTALLAGAGVRVPRILAEDCARGWMLLEDLGAATLADLRQRPWTDLAAWFADAAGIAGQIARLPRDVVAALNPPLDAALMSRELAQTREVFLVPRGLASDPLDAALAALGAALAGDPAVPCHRDFMARNLMPVLPLAAGRVAVLDHQDLRLGPPAYDLASLLNDTLFPPPDLEERLVEAALPGTANRLRYHRAAAQRTLKAVGTYAAFARRGADRHLPLIAPTLRRFLHHFGRTPEGSGLASDLEMRWREALADDPGRS